MKPVSQLKTIPFQHSLLHNNGNCTTVWLDPNSYAQVFNLDHIQMPSNKPSSHKLRKARISIQNQVYLVTFVTNDRTQRFKDIYSARLLIQSMMNTTRVETLAFIVMPDHVHWLVQLKDNTSLSKIVQITKSVSAQKINRHLGRKGRFWQDGFHDHAVRKEKEVIDAARYIVANPLRAGLVSSVAHYPHWDAVWL